MAASSILVFAGSLRAESFNRKLAHVAAEGARRAGATVTAIDLRDYPLPVMDEDLEQSQGLPANALRLKELFRASDGLIIGCPEYNSSITAALKNVIDWVSRPEPSRPPLDCFTGKVAGLVSASPGALGGLRGLVHVRAILGNIGVLVLPDQFALVRSHEAFGADGALKDAKQQQVVEAIGARVAHVAAQLRTAPA